MRDVNRTAAAIAEETANPSIMDRFRMPSGSGDMMLRTKLTAFADAIVELNLAAAFAEHGLTVTEADLRQMAQDFNESEGEQGEALGGRAGATASIPVILRGGRSAVKTLNAIFHNTYKNDASKLGAWKTVSRVQRDNPNGDGETPPPTPRRRGKIPREARGGLVGCGGQPRAPVFLAVSQAAWLVFFGSAASRLHSFLGLRSSTLLLFPDFLRSRLGEETA